MHDFKPSINCLNVVLFYALKKQEVKLRSSRIQMERFGKSSFPNKSLALYKSYTVPVPANNMQVKRDV